MSSIIKSPYEISVWDDIHNGSTLDERKLLVIGSDTMTSPCRAHNPSLQLNINGTSNFSFTLYYKYTDENGELVDNPFTSYLINERKIKLKYQDKWYDYIIKEINEDSDKYTFEYKCTDLFINELSKNGFNIELNTELYNSQGTLLDLADEVLADTDWRTDRENSNTGYETSREAMYTGTLASALVCTQIFDGTNIVSNTYTAPAGSKIYIFYSSVNSSVTTERIIQFIFNENNQYDIDNDGVVIAPNQYMASVTGELKNYFLSGTYQLTGDFTAKRLVSTTAGGVDTYADLVINKYNETATNKEVYGYYTTKYLTSDIVTNFLVNYSTFTSTDGWSPDSGSSVAAVLFNGTTYYPKYGEDIPTDLSGYTPRLMMSNTASNSIKNDGLRTNAETIGSITVNDQYMARIKCSSLGSLKLKLCSYTTQDNHYVLGNSVIDFTSFTYNAASGYYEAIATATQSLNYKNLISALFGIFLYGEFSTFIENIQFFKVRTYNGTIIYPDDVPTSESLDEYHFYYPYNGDDIIYDSAEEIKYLYEGTSPTGNNQFTPKYTNYEKIRTLEVAESNRFNILQSLAEKFECWVQFNIAHESNGKIKLTNLDKYRIISNNERAAGPQTGVQYYYLPSNRYTYVAIDTSDGFNSNINYYTKETLLRPDKKVVYRESVGQNNYVGFKYGTNLKSIARVIKSDDLVTKLIVKANSNEYADGGSCDIQKASENYEGNSFILNLDYFTQKGLVDYSTLQHDLYDLDTSGGYLAYYTQLREINSDTADLISAQTGYSMTALKNEANYLTYNQAAESATDNFNKNCNLITNYCGSVYNSTTDTWTPALTEAQANQTKIKDLLVSNQQNKSNAAVYKALATTALSAQTVAEALLATVTQQLAEKNTERETLDRQFYNKYFRFVQEGSWVDENYMDSNEYYLDAKNVLYTSSKPQVEYTLNVIDIAALDEYKDYQFNIGDITTIEDIEFFGYDPTKSIPTPYKEKVVVSELTISLDTPESNTIKIQNYKSGFDDLFQRVTATTQSLQYASGSYERAANAVTTDGQIAAEILQKSFYANKDMILGAVSQAITNDETGITISSEIDPLSIVRIINKGIVLTTDGGETWTTGITGSGINAETITSGTLNTAKVSVMAGDGKASAIWDANGITSYKHDVYNGLPRNFDYSTFTRVDQFGFYGIKNYTAGTNFVPEDIDDVYENAAFGLTWNGFFLNCQEGGYAVKVVRSETEFNNLKDTLYIKVNDNYVTAKDSTYDSEATYYEKVTVSTTINDAGIKITKGSTNVFYADTDGNLHLTGTLDAVNGEFRGTVKAGIIDGSTIKASTIESTSISIGSGNTTFTVDANGEMTATGADITGDITCDSLTVNDGATVSGLTVDTIKGGKTSLTDNTAGFYLGPSGFNLGDANTYLTLNISSGTIDMKGLKSTYVAYQKTSVEDTQLGYWMGADGVNIGDTNSTIKWTSSGGLYVGGSTSFMTWTSTDGLKVSGDITASKLTLGDSAYLYGNIYRTQSTGSGSENTNLLIGVNAGPRLQIGSASTSPGYNGTSFYGGGPIYFMAAANDTYIGHADLIITDTGTILNKYYQSTTSTNEILAIDSNGYITTTGKTIADIGSGGGSSYTGGTGITISSNIISITGAASASTGQVLQKSSSGVTWGTVTAVFG